MLNFIFFHSRHRIEVGSFCNSLKLSLPMVLHPMRTVSLVLLKSSSKILVAGSDIMRFLLFCVNLKGGPPGAGGDSAFDQAMAALLID